MNPRLPLLACIVLPVLPVLLAPSAAAATAAPRDALPLDTADWPANYRMHVEGASSVRLDGLTLPLESNASHDIAVEFPANAPAVLRVWKDGKLVRGPEIPPALAGSEVKEYPTADLNLGSEFTAVAVFQTTKSGTLFSQSAAQWSKNSKALFIKEGKLSYQTGTLKPITGGPKVDNGKPHTAVVSLRGESIRLWLDGKVIAEKAAYNESDAPSSVFKLGRSSADVAADFSAGQIDAVRVWKRALADKEIALLFKNDGAGANTPDFTHSRAATLKPEIQGGSGWVQPLERSDHAEIVAGWNDKTLKEGAEIYKTLCVVCHGTVEQPGSLPTALRFGEGKFKNGSDPYSMYLTLTKGFGQMVAQPQYTTAQKYAVIQYIRETFIRPHNPSQFIEVTPKYLTGLPKGLAKAEAEQEDHSLPQYKRMDLGPALFWTFQVAPGNIAQKGIAVRLDEGTGGVSKGRAWMVYDHDTMRVAAATTGDFVDWKGIAFDGSHGTHTSLAGVRHFVNPVGPGWASPNGGWTDDQRVLGKDGKRYGPLPRTWAQFEGVYENGNRVVIAARIKWSRVLESPGWIDYGSTPVFTRTVNVGPPGHKAETDTGLTLRVAPDDVNVVLKGQGTLKRENGFWTAFLPYRSQARLFISKADAATLESLAKTVAAPMDLDPLTQGGPAKWSQTVTTTSVAGKEDAPFIADTFPLPEQNPWQSWLRPGGFDFTPDGKAAVIAMWNGDVWRVEGIDQKAPATLTWRRIASGLFQPLGVKFRGEELFINCRDQIARLRDLNGDGEIDFIECFNDDAQVTEHFHEFSMGLQTDAAGNFYYAKSGRHALDSVVPQHGTLLRVSADGSKTDILATGFRAANGVCLNDDGTFFVTDQEGFWTPKNRINRVKIGGFYGNMFGYTNVTDTSDSAMEQPMVWITNAKDRSPAELVWIPKNVWGNLGGSLLNLSYGTGRAFIVPHEEISGKWQGAVCELPLPAFPSGIMRGRFGSDGALYTCGMFAWAGNATTPGGFYRIRKGDQPARVPLEIHASKGSLSVTFSDPVEIPACTLKVWSLKRSAKYGSEHYNEHPVAIAKVTASQDKRTLTFEVPELASTQCYELAIGDRVLHGTIHELR